MKTKRIAFIAVVVLIIGMIAVLRQSKTSAVSEVASAPGLAPSAPVLPASSSAAPRANQAATVRGTKPYVLASSQKFVRPLRLAAEALGARTVGMQSANKLLIEADEAAVSRLRADGRFTSVDECLPSGKISPGLAAAIAGGAKSVEAAVVFLSPDDRARVTKTITAGGGEILKGCLHGASSLRARIPAELVGELAARGEVSWMESFVRPHLMNDYAVEPAAMNVRSVWTAPGGLTGEGQIITTSDSGIDTGDLATLHEDLRERVCGIRVVDGCSTNDVNGHGTHTAGSIVGDGTHSDGQIRGTAWGARLYAWFCGSGGSGVKTPETYEQLFCHDAESLFPATYIHSASWGSNLGGQYTAECLDLDEYIWSHPETLPVFSAGNSGSEKSTVGSPAAAKNVLAVGATQNLRPPTDECYTGDQPTGLPDLTADYSSRGPCLDGRIKPDIAAPGSGVLSTRATGVNYSYGISTNFFSVITNETTGVVTTNEWYAYDTGTSMACPLTAGSVALVRQWLVDRRGFADEEGSRPTAALMKAVVTGGAKGAVRPGNEQGWGRVDLAETLFPSNRAVKLVDRIPFADGEVFSWVVETTNAAPLDVQLAWIDCAGHVGSPADAQLVNNLDLLVMPLDDGEGTVLFGNGGIAADDLNTLESVRLESAAPGRYLVVVNCKSVLRDWTEGGAAALYIRGAFDPAVDPAVPENVRIVGGDSFVTLDEALAVAGPDATIEVLRRTWLLKPFAFSAGCTIVATNDVPALSPVQCVGDASLSVDADARLFLSNVVFSSVGEVRVEVAAGGKVALAGQVAVDAIRTADDAGIELAGLITHPVAVDCQPAEESTNGAPFGVWTTDEAVANACANYFLNLNDDELGGLALADGRLVWGLVPVPEAAAAVKLEQDEELTNYRSFAALLKYYNPGNDATIRVCKDCPLAAPVRIENGRRLSIDGDSHLISVSENAGFEIVDGSTMVVSNATFSGTVSSSLFSVGDKKSAGELVFGGGAVADGVSGRSEIGGGVVLVYGGYLRMEEGSRMSGCRAEHNKACGGAVYLGPGAIFDLKGGVITDCYAASAGGGVYVDSIIMSATVNISGASAVFGNASTEKLVMDDICFENSKYSQGALNLTGRLEGEKDSIGIRFGLMGGLGGEGDAFAACGGVSAADAEASAAVFLNDAKPDELIAAVSGAQMVWETNSLGPGGCDPALASVRVVYPDGVTNFYDHVGTALDHLSGDCALELLQDDTFEGELQIAFAITLRSAPEAGGTFVLERADAGKILVRKGASLTVEDVRISGTWGGFTFGSGNLIAVNGGVLALKDGAEVGHVSGGTTRADGVITVYGGGRLTMEGTALVSDGKNPYFDEVKDVDSGVGGGILVDGDSVAEFKGGQVVGCRASRGGGVVLANKSTAYVSGDFTATGNKDRNGAANDFTTEDLSSLVLADDFTGSVGIAEGVKCDTNVFGRVDDRYYGQASFTSLTNGAANFFHDVRGVRGVVATNGTDTALLVWSDAFVDVGGTPTFVFVDANGVPHTYWAMGELPTPLPPPPPPEPQWEVVTNHPGPIAFKSIERVSDTEWTLVVTNRARYCNYRLIWAKDLKQGFVSTGDWEHVVHEDCATWTTNVITTGGAWFWRAEGADGTNMILKVVK